MPDTQLKNTASDDEQNCTNLYFRHDHKQGVLCPVPILYNPARSEPWGFVVLIGSLAALSKPRTASFSLSPRPWSSPFCFWITPSL